ncbi:hypothetical protein [Arthrobacter sp. H14]|uniref:hypothetical protein n=1 Tax=Arthrobacter sp. H14 TaxID=1312959 RepID=UPI000478A8B3|nr:hypothetical protein [Arthrobacter sp. H14]
MEDNLPPVVGLSQPISMAAPAASPVIDVQDVIEAADQAHHRIRQAIHGITGRSHRVVAFLAQHQGSPDIARLERERDQVQLQMYRNSGMR